MFKKFTDSGIINAADLNNILSGEHRAEIKIIDATFVLPTCDENPALNYDAAHIRGTQFFDIRANANPDSTIPNTLPTPPDFARTINAMGISNDDFIIIYGQNGMVMGPARLWWMFRVYGHDHVCVLNGGLPAWVAAGYGVTDAPTPAPTHSPKFTTDFQNHLFTDIKTVKRHCDAAPASTTTAIIDARSHARFSGQTPEPRENMRSGHIPRSINIPAKSLIDDAGLLKDKTALRTMFTAHDILDKSNIITTCGSGITACMLALGLFHIGHKNVAVYDGSWSEWGRLRQ